MKKIVYNEQTILDAKKNVEMCNDSILEALRNFQNEFINMDKVVSTPKMNKSLPIIQEYIHNKISYVNNNRDNYNKTFNTINDSYHDYLYNVNQMVGDDND